MCITLKKYLPPINFRFCGQILENVTSHPYLGVQLDSKLCWKEHIEFVVKSANKILGLIKRNFWFCDESVKLTLYKTLVRPKLEFTTSVWDPHYKCDIRRIEDVQRAAARFCKSDYRYTSSISIMLDSLGLEPLETRRKVGRLSIMYTIIHGFVDLNVHNYLQSSKKTRAQNSHAYKFQTPL